MDRLLYQPGVSDPDIRAVSLPTLNDNDLLSVAALFWTQIGWIYALTVSGWTWIPGLMLADLALFASRWRMRRGLDLLGRRQGDASAVRFVSTNFGHILMVSICASTLAMTHSDRAAILAIILTIGFSGYAAALFTAFPRMAAVNIGLLYGASAVSMALGPSDLARPFVLLCLPAAGAFWLLTRQTHIVLLHAIRSQHENLRLSLRDSLTGLSNRNHMHAALTEHLTAIGTPAGRVSVAILCLDLDEFKAINDGHGHAAGDRVLIHVADILQRCIGDGDLACRMGGDEYIVILPNADETRVLAVGRAILSAVSEPFAIVPGRSIRIGISIGTVLTRSPSTHADLLLEEGDGALYAAKRSGRNTLHSVRRDVA